MGILVVYKSCEKYLLLGTNLGQQFLHALQKDRFLVHNDYSSIATLNISFVWKDTISSVRHTARWASTTLGSWAAIYMIWRIAL
ncbi:hypothetical protein WAI453_012404 [Rhynchosporium graminicola]